MSYRTRKLMLALENEEVLGSEVEVAEVPAEVEQSVAEVSEDAGEIGDMVDSVDEAGEDVGDLQDIHDVMADSVEKGEGLDETAAEVAEVAVESICRRLGFKPNGVMPAMESFGSKNSRVTATKLAMEGVMDRIKSIGKAIKDFFIKIWEYIKAFYGKFFDVNVGVVKAAEKLLAKVKEIKSDWKAEKANFENSSVASAINTGSSTASADTAKKILTAHAELAKDALETASQLTNNSTNIISNVTALTTKTVDATALKKDQEELKRELKEMVDARDGKKEVETNITTATVSGLISNKEVEYVANFENFTFRVAIIEGKEPTKSKEVPVLSVSDMISLCEAAKKLAEETQEFRKSYARVESLYKNALQMADRVTNATKAGGDEKAADAKEQTKAISDNQNLLTSSFSSISRLCTAVPSINAQAAKAVLNYVASSAKEYKAPEKKAA